MLARTGRGKGHGRRRRNWLLDSSVTRDRSEARAAHGKPTSIVSAVGRRCCPQKGPDALCGSFFLKRVVDHATRFGTRSTTRRCRRSAVVTSCLTGLVVRLQCLQEHLCRGQPFWPVELVSHLNVSANRASEYITKINLVPVTAEFPRKDLFSVNTAPRSSSWRRCSSHRAAGQTRRHQTLKRMGWNHGVE